ncbi:MAG: hypothetical protein JO065_16320, partial [Acidobacteria bacterium]|nr:hypothetical protein [Acidobacteriota bacterium]
QASLVPGGTQSSVTAHLVISAAAQPGPRTVTFSKVNGSNTAAIFTVIAPPGLQGTDAASLKKHCIDVLAAEQQAADASNATLKAALQQEVDQGLQAIQQSNSKLPQPLATNQITQQLAAIVAGAGAAGNRETQAVNAADASIDQLVVAMEAKIQGGNESVGNIAADLDKQFAPINQAFQAALAQVHTDLAAQAAAQIQAIDQVVAGVEQTITAAAQQQMVPPTPKVDAEERSVEQGFQTSFDASGSTSVSGANIASTTWMLCDPSYHPAQVGVALPGNAPGCRAVPGFSATSGQFQFNTCALTPADYIARVTVIDSNGKSSAMDVRLHVTQPAYDDPPTRLQDLAGAYTSLQSQQFLAFFDSVNYAGYTQLQENIRDTFLKLGSMQINLRLSQANVSCNDATLRADWEQKYTFKSDQTCVNAAAGSSCQKVVFSQSEQLTARMTRAPGKGWFITDFQGDNGTVQGSAPGPQTSFAALPNLQISGLQIANASASPQDQARRIRSAGSQSVVGLAPGQSTQFTAVVTNVGNAPLTEQPKLHFALLDSSGAELTAQTQDLPTLPLNPGDSENVTGTLTVPTLAPSTPVSIGATVNPGCKVQEQTCGAKDFVSLNAIAGTVALKVTNIAPTGQLVVNQSATVNVTVTNSGTAPSSPSSLTLTAPGGTLATTNVPAIGAGATVTIPVQIIVPNTPGQQSVTATVSASASTTTITPAPASATTSVTIVAVGAYVITSIASATTPNPPTGVNAFQKGQDVNLQATIANNGASSPSGNLTLKLTCNAPCQFGTTPSATVAAPAAGQSTTATLILPALALTPAVGYVATLSIDAASAPPQSSTAGNSATFAFDVADFMLANASNISGDLNVKLGSQGMFNVNLTEQGVDVGSIPVTIGPAVSGISYQTPSSFSSNSTNTITVLASGNALPGASTPVTITGTRFGVSHAAMQSVRTYTASLENFSPGQPGSLQTQPIILPIKGAAPTLNIRLSGNFYTPGGGTQLTFPTVSGISITPSATTAAAGDVIALHIAAIQGAALNQTIPLIINAQIPNTNPAATETLTIFVRPTALPDLAVSGVSVSGRNFAANPLLSGEPVDVQITVANLGAGSSQGFERVHLGLNGRELTNGGVSVPQALAAGSSTTLTVHIDAPDPVPTGSSTLTARVEEDAAGDLNAGNDAMSISINTSDWGLSTNTGTNGGNSDANPLTVIAG